MLSSLECSPSISMNHGDKTEKCENSKNIIDVGGVARLFFSFGSRKSNSRMAFPILAAELTCAHGPLLCAL